MFMKRIFYVVFVFLTIIACVPSGNAPVIAPNDLSKNLTKIAIGSCCSQGLNMFIFKSIVAKNPDLYIAMGDNMYTDLVPGEYSLANQKLQYNKLGSNAYFKKLRAAVPVIATWDDHDYGKNNAGSEFPFIEVSKKQFLDFWVDPADSDRRSRPGVYTSYMYGDADHKVQIILLDTRTFMNVISAEPITPTLDTNKTLLGAAQWAWLKQELQKPAKIRIVVSSSQMCIQNNGWEGWPNYPHELNKFFRTIKETQAENLFVVSGDVHYSEFSKRTPVGQYPIYDFTSSALTHKENAAAPNQYRLGNAYNNINFGMLNINWNTTPIQVGMEICDKDGIVVQQRILSMDELTF
jgi:alkaline phosphatase D